MRHFKKTRQLESIDHPGIARLVEEYVLPGTPVVIRGALADTKLQNWSPEYLKRRIGRTPARIAVAANGRYELNQDENEPILEATEMRIADFIDEVVRSPRRNQPGCLYLQQTSIPTNFPHLLQDIPVSRLVRPQLLSALNLWMGPAGTTSPLHYDLANNFLCQVFGKKEVVLFEAAQTPVLYPFEVGASRFPHLSQVDIEEPNFELHPRLRQAVPSVATLHPGDVLVIPSCCWHQVRSISASISINAWWRSFDSQLLLESFSRLMPLHYQRPPNFFHASIKRQFASFADYARTLWHSGRINASALCHLMLLEGHLESLGRPSGVEFPRALKGPDAALHVVDRLAHVAALSAREHESVRHWFELGRELMSCSAADTSRVESMVKSISAIIAPSAFSDPHGRPSLGAA